MPGKIYKECSETIKLADLIAMMIYIQLTPAGPWGRCFPYSTDLIFIIFL